MIDKDYVFKKLEKLYPMKMNMETSSAEAKRGEGTTRRLV